jgi:hypothetical protein
MIYFLTCRNLILDVEEQMDGDMFRFVTEGVILTIVSTFGFIGNAMSVIVLTRTATGLR